MIFCLDCRRAWPGDSKRCGSCGRTFHGRRCPSDHLSPVAASKCVACGSDELSETARSLRLDGVARMLAWLCAPLVAKALWANLDDLVGAGLQIGEWLFAFVFGAHLPQVLWNLILPIVQVAVFAAVLSAVCPGFRKRLPSMSKFAFRAARSCAKSSVPVLKTLFALFKHLIQGKPDADKKR